ncbi:MAG: class I SAM-dependent methyltransferase [Ferruginibacter sp.]
MDRDYFDKYYQLERTHWWFLVRSKILRGILKSRMNNQKSLSILNVGSATGGTSQMLEEFGEVISVEYDRLCFEFARQTLKLAIINASILDLPFENERFDLVCAFDVIEHVEDDAKAVSEMYRVCKPTGYLFITVPAFQSIWSTHDKINHHYRRYSIKDILKLLDGKKGEMEKIKYFNSILFIPIFIVRKIQSLFASKKPGLKKSDFELIKSPIINKLFYSIFNLERIIFKRISFPFGVSILALWKKK